MALDCRIDRDAMGDPLDLGLLTLERLDWSMPRDAPEDQLARVRSLNEGQWALLVLEITQGQVDNGGFFQFLDNSGEFLEDAARAARLVGADDYAALLEEVERLFPDGLPRDGEERGEFLDEVRDGADGERIAAVLEAIDDRFYALRAAAGDLYDHAVRYAERHPEQFYLSPEEARRDVDDLVARLRERAGPLPPASAGTVDAAEQRLDRPLPPLLRRVYTDVGDGGWGPGGGLLALLTAVERFERLRAGVRGPTDEHRWPDDALPVAGEARHVVCVRTAPPHAVDAADLDHLAWSPLQTSAVLRFEAPSLRGWLERWAAA